MLQHQGVMDIPGCWSPSFNGSETWGCRLMEKVLGFGAYLPWVQRSSVQAQYFKDPGALEAYRARSEFLADINVESAMQRPGSAAMYRSNLLTLQRLVLYQFDNDVTVVPRESSHFGEYDGEELRSMEETGLYTEDRIGLRELNDRGRLYLEHAPGFHMQFSLEWFVEEVVGAWLVVEVESRDALMTGSAVS
jgi:palmitoyl-protein thioesterase